MEGEGAPRQRSVILGLVDSQDDCGACVVRDGRLVAAVNEERLTGRKLQGGFPSRSLEEALSLAGVGYGDVDAVAVGGVLTPPPFARLARRLQAMEAEVRASRARTGAVAALSDLVQFRLKLHVLDPGSRAGRALARMVPALVRKDLPRPLRRRPLELIDHHVAHAAGAYFLSGRDPVLAVTADGEGDGRSLTVSRCEGGVIERLAAMDGADSYGWFYSAVTHWLGFLPHRHEGKTLGLAARGDPDAVDAPFPFTPEGRYLGRWGRAGEAELARALAGERREDVAAWAQRHVEERMKALVGSWVGRTQLGDLALSGGLFSNVRLNQRLWELDGVRTVFVLPHMGDGGLAVGAALALARPRPEPLPHLFLGRSYGEEEVRLALDAAGVRYERPEDLEAAVAELLEGGAVVGRFDGGSEWGPRALGNRSILVRATDPRELDRLNERLRRSPFMPFAPLVMEERVEMCIGDISGAELPAATMTMTFDCTPWMRERCPGAVHLDGTARPQVVSARTTPKLHRILSLYEEATGLPVVVNTSFNMHESPIVYSPEDAIRTFKEGAADRLAIGPFLASPP